MRLHLNLSPTITMSGTSSFSTMSPALPRSMQALLDQLGNLHALTGDDGQSERM
jgi:hypothetical protein